MGRFPYRDFSRFMETRFMETHPPPPIYATGGDAERKYDLDHPNHSGLKSSVTEKKTVSHDNNVNFRREILAHSFATRY